MPEETEKVLVKAPKVSVFTNFGWPLKHIIYVMGLGPVNEAQELDLEPANAVSDVGGHLGAIANALRATLLAYLCIYIIHGGPNEDGYAAYGRAATWEWSWMWPILVRNIIGCYLLCGFWDWFLYYSPVAPAFRPFKIVPDYPTAKQLKHDIFWTTSATVTGTMLEWFWCHLMATGTLTFDHDPWQKPGKYLFWAFFLTHAREPHFYLIHRMMHPWRIQGCWDAGKFLYRNVHYLHHKSYNTTAFSGTSMHPVESTIYYSSCMIPWLFQCHPIASLGIIFDCGIAAWLGHGGFVFPGTGDVYHVVHHVVFDCNYGTSNVPMDYLFGTFAARYEDVKTIWAHQKAKCGIEGNESVVHDKATEKTKIM